MTPQDLVLYKKKMVIQFGEGIQGVKWLGNHLYPVNSIEIHTILYFLQLLEVNVR
jgi:hypothetical protein